MSQTVPFVTIEADGLIAFEITTLGLSTGEAWYDTLVADAATKGRTYSKEAKDFLCGSDFLTNHLYPPGTVLKVILIKGAAIPQEIDFDSQSLQKLFRLHYGNAAVDGLKAELALLLHLKFSDQELEDLGLKFVGTLHRPILHPDVSDEIRFEWAVLIAYFLRHILVFGKQMGLSHSS